MTDTARRALSHNREAVSWPPRIGERVHYNSGWAHTSWSGEVRAVVDDTVAIVREWWKHKRYYHWRVVHRIEVMVWNERKHEAPNFRYGGLPRGVTDGEE